MSQDKDESVVQDNYMDEQNFEVDIEETYKKVIVEIDKIRSSNKDVKESRCHAFYRLLGLPVVSSDGETLFCPGQEAPKDNNNATKNAAKKTVTNNIKPDLFRLMEARENAPKEFLSVFFVQGLDASGLAMSSVETRSFVSPLEKNEDPLDTKIENQSYTIDLASRINVNLKDYNDKGPTKLSNKRAHILKPFMVNPKIDEGVTPKANRICVPFLTDKSETKLSDNVFLKRPFIEKICRERFNVSEKNLFIGEHTKAIIESIKNDASIKDEGLIKSVFSPSLATSEAIQFANTLNIIRSMLKKLSKAVDEVSTVLATDPKCRDQALYNWIPIPSKNGPEFGCTTQNLVKQPPSDANRPRDKEIIEALYLKEILGINNKLKSQQAADLGGFAFDNTELTPDVHSSDGWGDINGQSLESLGQEREAITNIANASLRDIEIIMGEFSGLGLCDVLAISAAFWIVDKTTLINLLDDQAAQRMVTNPNLKDAEAVSRANSGRTMKPKDALAKFETKVKEVFNIMDKIYDDIRNKNMR